MFDSHTSLHGQTVAVLGIPVYSIFVCLGFFAGVIYYVTYAKTTEGTSKDGMIILGSALLFGMIGSKVPILLEGNGLVAVAYGKSIVGGLLGGMFGVMFTKRLLKIKSRMGNVIAPAAALGMAIGRIGCFFNGCCYGIHAPWGVDFGDGRRLPTQLFEAAFDFGLFLVLHHYRDKVQTPGILFKILVIAYFTFRFIIEFIRENQHIWAGFTIYQIICVVGVLYMGIRLWRDLYYERKAE